MFNYILIFILILIITFLAYKLFKTRKQLNTTTTAPEPSGTQPTTPTTDIDSNTEIEKYPYEKRLLLTNPEYAFYKILKVECDKRNMLICPKVRMADFLKITDEQHKQSYLNQIISRHIDFLICDSNLYLLAGLELDDSSHNSQKAKKADHLKNEIFKTINVPLYRIHRANGAYQPQIEKALDELLKLEEKRREKSKDY